MKPRDLACHAALALVFVFALVTGLRGIDFGWHWDEDRLLESVQASLRTGTLLPGRYNYPSVSYALTMLAAAPEAAVTAADAERVIADSTSKVAKQEGVEALGERLAAIVDRPEFKLRARALFLVVSLLAIPWTYLAALAMRREAPEALLAAALLAGSWAFATHARWMAPDAVLAQWAAIGLIPLAMAQRGGAHATRRLAAAAAAAGLAAGTKYPGVVLLAPVLAAAWAAAPPAAGRARLLRVAALALLAGGVFLATTPGVLLQPARAGYDLLFEWHHYHTGHGAETVAPGAAHAGRIAAFLALSAFSRWWPLAALVFVAALGGAVVVLRRDRPAAVALLLAPALAIALMVPLRVMFARNLLLLLPSLALLAARGASALAARSRAGALAVLVAGVAIVSANAAWLSFAADSIASRAQVRPGEDLARWLRAHPDQRVALSPGAAAALPPADRGIRSIAPDPSGATRVVVWSRDVRTPWGGRPGAYEQVSGPYEVDYDWYPDWAGDPRLVVTSPAVAARLGLGMPGLAPPR
jgi:4-amino-4-deoxy-L-arabinose transferase-like glycosyltransferase